MKCPSCKKPLTNVIPKKIDAQVPLLSGYRSMAYLCPHIACGAVISIGIDPDALIREIADLLGKARS